MKTGKQLFSKKSLVAGGIVALASLLMTANSQAIVIASNVDPTLWVPYDNYDASGSIHTISGFGTWARSTPILIPGGTTQLQFSVAGSEVTNPLDPLPHDISADGFNNITGLPSLGATAGALAAAYPGFSSGGQSWGLFSLANQSLPTSNPLRTAQAVGYVNNGLDGAVYGMFFDPNYFADFGALPAPTVVDNNHTSLLYNSLAFNEPFFIGDGLTGNNFNGSTNGLAQTFNIPSGASGPIYLLLSLAADPNVIDNTDDSIKITVKTPGGPVPEPSTWLFGMAILGVIGKTTLGMWRCRGLIAR